MKQALNLNYKLQEAYYQIKNAINTLIIMEVQKRHNS